MGEDIDLPDGSYPGDYLLPLAENLIDKFGKKLKDLEEFERDKIIRELSVEYDESDQVRSKIFEH